MPHDDLLDTGLDRMERALQQFRGACYDQVSRAAYAQGLFGSAEPFTTEEFARRAGIGADRTWQAGLFLTAMTRWGALHLDGEGRYVAAPRTPEFVPDPNLMCAAIGKPRLEDYPDFDNFAGLVDELLHHDGATGAGFHHANLPLWEEALQAPYYRFSRLHAVSRLAVRGPHLLDLACGLGHGLIELAESLGDDPQTRLVGVEISTDFAELAAARTAGNPHIAVLCADLDAPLPGLPTGGFDGAMIVGGYHFLDKPEMLWETTARLLKPGGAFILAHVLSRTGSPDQELMELRFALRRPPGHPALRTDILDYARRHGFELTEEFTLGCYRTLEFTRLDHERRVESGTATIHHLEHATLTVIPVGPLRTNACLLRCHRTGARLLIDAGAEADNLLAAAAGRLDTIVTTHGDWDHFEALSEVAAATGARCLAHENDLRALGVAADPLRHDDTIEFGACRLDVIHVAGHTPGSIVLALRGTGGNQPDYLFTGDALFPGGIGTTWGNTHAFETLSDNIEHRIFDVFDDDTVVIPGHGPSTTLGAQRPDLAAWRQRRW